MSTPDFSHLDDPAEREWLTNVSPMDVLKNAHRIYDFMAEAGLPSESVVREEAFRKASQALGTNYEVFYQAWLNEMPVGPAAIRHAKSVAEPEGEGQAFFRAVQTAMDEFHGR